MRIGTIVRIKDDPWKILGIIVHAELVNEEWLYRVNWLDDLCDVTFVDQWSVEVICE